MEAKKKEAKNSKDCRIAKNDLKGSTKLQETSIDNVILIGGKARVDFPSGDFYFGELKDHLYHGKGYYYSK